MIRIGETPVLLADPKGQLDRFFEAHHTTKLIRAFTESASVKIPRGKNLLFPNYPDLPLARLNQIVVPTGATRWSYGLFLVTTAQKDAILEESAASDNKLTVDPMVDKMVETVKIFRDNAYEAKANLNQVFRCEAEFTSEEGISNIQKLLATEKKTGS